MASSRTGAADTSGMIHNPDSTRKRKRESEKAKLHTPVAPAHVSVHANKHWSSGMAANHSDRHLLVSSGSQVHDRTPTVLVDDDQLVGRHGLDVLPDTPRPSDLQSLYNGLLVEAEVCS